MGLSKVRLVGDNVMACCPFHDDSSPSFGVHVDSGAYNCFGCGATGPFQLLVKHLGRFDTVFNAEEFLISKYGQYSTVVNEPLELSFSSEIERLEYYITEEHEKKILRPYRYRHPYLTRRGITEKWQRLFGIGYSRDKRAITIPYRDCRGRLVSVKFRKTSSKAFWYDPPMPGRVKAETLWGLDKVLKWGLKKIAVTEGEIDALSIWQAETVGAIAIGGNQFTDEQAKKILHTIPNDVELIVFTDNDAGGDLAKDLIIDKLMGKIDISIIDWSLVSGNPKDANDINTEQIKNLIANRRTAGISLKF